MSASSVLPATAQQGASQPLDLAGGRRRRSRRGGADEVPVAAPVAGRRSRVGGDEPLMGDVPVAGGEEVPLGGRRKMTRKQRAGVKKVAKALKAANKKAHRLALTLKKKLGRGRL